MADTNRNLLIFPNLESANLSMTLLKEMTNALAVVIYATRGAKLTSAKSSIAHPARPPTTKASSESSPS